MWNLALLLLHTTVVLGGLSTQRIEELTSQVVQLGDDDFQETIQEFAGTGHILVEFFAPWCGFCKKVAPEYERLPQMHKDSGDNQPIMFAQVDATIHEELKERFEIQGYPTILFLHRLYLDRPITFQPQSADDLSAAKMLTFTHEHSKVPFVEKNDTSRVLEFSADNLTAYTTIDEHDEAGHLLVVHYYNPNNDFSANLKVELEFAAAAFEDNPSVIFANFNADQNQGHPLVKGLGQAHPLPYPVVMVYILRAPFRVLAYSGPRQAGEIVKYLYLQGGVGPVSDIVDQMQRHQPWLPSELSPTNGFGPFKRGRVLALTDDTFVRVALDPRVHVVVAFTAPWCGHCKKLKPAYERLARVRQYNTGMIIAEVDADKYKKIALACSVDSYPTIKIFRRRLKDRPLEITHRSLEALDHALTQILQEPAADPRASTINKGEYLDENGAVLDEDDERLQGLFAGRARGKVAHADHGSRHNEL